MSHGGRIDVAFDFRSDTPGYPSADPDSRSPTLRRYHKHLWSKSLPNGELFELVDTTPGIYLHHRSHSGEFRLASDTVIPSFRKDPRVTRYTAHCPEVVDSLNALGYTIGGMMLFPGNRIDGKMTINGARGCHPRIKDRFDHTVECIRRHYRGETSPLTAALERYAGFFRLFGDFPGYVEFFLLQDIVTADSSAVKFFTPFEDFTTSPVPVNLEEYMNYRQGAMEFIEARNRRISQTAGG